MRKFFIYVICGIAPRGLPLVASLMLAMTAIENCFSQEIDLTVYNQNLGLVKDRRNIKIDKGVQKIEFTDVAAQIDLTSVHFKSLSYPNKCSVLEQNFEYDLISREKLLQKYIGKEIELERRFGKDGEKKDARTNEYKLKIPKNGENTITYTIHYWWD